jgi:hypothetical protein
MSGERLGINMDCIITIIDNYECTKIITIVEEYEVQESYAQCVNTYNDVKRKHDLSKYVNFTKN